MSGWFRRFRELLGGNGDYLNQHDPSQCSIWMDNGPTGSQRKRMNHNFVNQSLRFSYRKSAAC